MIEFNGHITGVAQKRFFQKARGIAQNILISGELIVLMICLAVGARTESSFLITLSCVMIVATFLLVRIPKSKKEGKAITPKRIYTDGETIVCVADKYSEAKKISDVKLVKDYGAFYELIFPFGNISDKFICQKDLLIKGTIEEFERLFEGKIVRKINSTGAGLLSPKGKTE